MISAKNRETLELSSPWLDLPLPAAGATRFRLAANFSQNRTVPRRLVDKNFKKLKAKCQVRRLWAMVVLFVVD